MSSISHHQSLSGSSPVRSVVAAASLPTTTTATKMSSERPRKARPEEFIFGKLIGEGSYACVFLAKEVSTSREFAIKVCEKRMIIRENKTEYIHREKAIMLLLSEYNEKRPYFVQLHSTFQDASRLYFVITYAKNGDLLRLINRLSTNSDEATSRATECARFYAAELVAAVEFLHEKGIIHRDLKPENILLNEKLHILITDFGSAKLVRSDGKRSNSGRRRRRTGDNRDGEHDSEADTSGDNYASDDATEPPVPKRKSFVGTPQYVSPEILTSRGSSRASDLWAIGCIIYQIMTGLPPFQSQSEFLIFKKIEKLDYSFHEGFNDDAKDLVQKLLVIEPQERLGAQDSEFYTSIRQHPFFSGLDFERLPEMVAPSVGMLPAAPEGPDPVWKRLGDAKPGAERIPFLMVEDGDGDSSGDDVGVDLVHLDEMRNSLSPPGNGSHLQKRSNSRRNKVTIEHLSPEERKSRLEDQAKNNEFHRFVEGNLIVKQGILYKKKGFFPKKRMFLLTEGPHLYYVDPDKMVLKGTIPWSVKVRTEVRNFRIFFVHVPGRTYYLIDHESRAKEWCDAIDEVKKFYYDATPEEQ